MATYRALIEPIYPKVNLANVQDREACQPCPRCRLLFTRNRHFENLDDLIDTFPDFPVLKASGKAGCGFCHLLRKTIRQSWETHTMEEDGVGPLGEEEGEWDELLSTAWDGKVRIYNLILRFQPLPGTQTGKVITALDLDLSPASIPFTSTRAYGNIYRVLSFKAFDSKDFPRDGQPASRRLPSRETLSADNIHMMQDWMHTCKRDHTACRLPPTSWVPSRLLAIETAQDGSICALHLVETAALSSVSSYAALSHMWGEMTISPPLRTVRANYDAMLHDIRLDDLPPNFLDAIVVCAHLHIFYLWIDSLCIIQDDMADWSREAVLMHRVYRHAEVTIVATSATSSHSGFLKRRLERIPAAKISTETSSDAASAAAPDCIVLCPVDSLGTGMAARDIEDSSWNTRGWTLQERALSTRLIHFCQNKLYFECRCSMFSEEGEPLAEPHSRFFQLWPWSMNSDEQGDPVHPYYVRWRNVISQYNRRGLTRDSDKLLAIRSLANEMEEAIATIPDIEVSQHRYIPFAGMWERDLAVQLMWQLRTDPVGSSTKTCAPSWSWASNGGVVGFQGGSPVGEDAMPPVLRDCFHVVNLGPLQLTASSGFLLLRSWVCPVSWIRYTEETDYWGLVNRVGLNFDIFTNVPEEDGKEDIFARGTLDTRERESNRLSLRDGQFAYVHIRNDNMSSGLLLRRVTGTLQPGCHDFTWMRIGVASLFAAKFPVMPSLFREDMIQEIFIV